MAQIMKVRLTFLGWLVVAGLLALAILLAWGMARASRWPGAEHRSPPTDHRSRGVHKSCVIRPVNVLEAGAGAVVTKYYVTATAKDVAPGGPDGGEERRYQLGEFRQHDQAIDACMDWVRCGTEK